MSFAPEPAFAHGTAAHAPRSLLCNLGTPEAPTPAAVRRYLAEFLSDPRVVEIPRLLWWPILHGVILRVRPARSARKYASIWTAGGLAAARSGPRSRRCCSRGYLGQRGHRVVVRHAMRYGQPSIASVLDALQGRGRRPRRWCCRSIRSTPAATTASIGDAVAAWCAGVRNAARAALRQALPRRPGLHRRARRSGSASTGRRTAGPTSWCSASTACRGASLTLGDPYHCECLKTGAAARRAAGAARRVRRRHLPEPLRQGRVAAALHRADAASRWPRGRRAGRRLLPRLRGRLPGDARGDRPGGARRVPRRRRQASSATCPASTTSTNGSPRWPASPMRHLQGWDTAPTAPKPATARKRSAGAPSPPARRPDRASQESRLRAGCRSAPIAMRASARPGDSLRPGPSVEASFQPPDESETT